MAILKKYKNATKKWWGSTISGILKKEIYKGIYVWGDERVKLPDLAILTEEEFEKVRDDLEKGRKGENEESGLNEQELPFYDFIIFNAYNDEEVSVEEKEKIKALVIKLVSLLRVAIDKPNFWTGREAEIRKLQGDIDDLLDFSDIDSIAKCIQN